jgi:hypothetical protein
MKLKHLTYIFFLSFLVINILVYIDYETVSLIETYRNFESVFEILFGTLLLFFIITFVFYIILKIIKKSKND